MKTLNNGLLEFHELQKLIKRKQLYVHESLSKIVTPQYYADRMNGIEVMDMDHNKRRQI